MFIELSITVLFAISIGVIYGIAINSLLSESIKTTVEKPSKPRIQKTITSLDYTGRNYNEWRTYISIINRIYDIKNNRNTLVNRQLSEWLESENILKINKQ